MRGHIHKRQRKGKNGKTRTLWYAVIDVGQGEGGRRKQKWLGGFETRREAEQALADLAQSLDKNTYIAPRRVTLGEFVRDDWLPTMRTQVKLSTWDSYRRNLENHVLPTLGGLPIQQITPGHLNSLYRGLLARGNERSCGGLSTKTVRNIHGAISKVMADAVDYGLLSRNIAFNARPPKPRKSGPKEIRFWTPEELSEFLASVRDDRLYRAVAPRGHDRHATRRAPRPALGGPRLPAKPCGRASDSDLSGLRARDLDAEVAQCPGDRHRSRNGRGPRGAPEGTGA